MNDIFSFKEFSIDQYGSAMKIGTDGVLLGAWASVAHQPYSILDIGAGSGLLALMLAQRCNAEQIDALEIEESAFEQCVENFEHSPWADRLFCYHSGLDEFLDEVDERYDLIISNPPFYTEKVSSGNDARDAARQTSSLPFKELLEGVERLLSAAGCFCTIIPFKEEIGFIELARTFNLHPRRIVNIRGNPQAEVKRSLLELSRKQGKLNRDELVIELKRHQYTPEYIHLTRPFYIKM